MPPAVLVELEVAAATQWKRWSSVERPSPKTVELRYGSRATRSSKRRGRAAGTGCIQACTIIRYRAVQIRKSPVLALVEALAQEIERRPPDFLAASVGPMVGLDVCSVAGVRETSMPSRMRPDGADGVGAT